MCDARPVFATAARFPDADEVVVEWPHAYLARTDVDARTVLCVLTHDPKFDVPLLRRALRLPVAYVGAMGSAAPIWTARRACARRASATWSWPASGPRSPRPRRPHPEETALSIAAEIVAARRGGTGASLTGARTPIHHDGRSPRRAGSARWPDPAGQSRPGPFLTRDTSATTGRWSEAVASAGTPAPSTRTPSPTVT